MLVLAPCLSCQWAEVAISKTHQKKLKSWVDHRKVDRSSLSRSSLSSVGVLEEVDVGRVSAAFGLLFVGNDLFANALLSPSAAFPVSISCWTFMPLFGASENLTPLLIEISKRWRIDCRIQYARSFVSPIGRSLGVSNFIILLEVKINSLWSIWNF